jgi:hypothetical protein
MAKILEMPPLPLLRERFNYCAETGKLTYRRRVSQRRKEGDEAGFVHWTGYKYVKLIAGDSKAQVAVHRIAWALHNGVLPPTDMEIDHIDRNKLNNRASNLRLVTRSENVRNTARSISHDAGRGVSLDSKKKNWRAYTYESGKQIHIGTFKTAEQARFAVAAFGG